MGKPEYLYHGSSRRLTKIEPQKAEGLPEENGDRFGVYATASFGLARRFAMPIEPVGGKIAVYFDEHTGRIVLKKGIVRRTDVGYVHTVRSDSFQKLDDHQWLSKEPVLPEAVTPVSTADLWDFIEFIDGHDR